MRADVDRIKTAEIADAMVLAVLDRASYRRVRDLFFHFRILSEHFSGRATDRFARSYYSRKSGIIRAALVVAEKKLQWRFFCKKALTQVVSCAIILWHAKVHLGVAQLVARYLGVVEAAGSSPVTQTKNIGGDYPFRCFSFARLIFDRSVKPRLALWSGGVAVFPKASMRVFVGHG